MLSFKCPQCHVALKVADDKAGQKGKCPKCHTPLVVPGIVAGGVGSSPIAAPPLQAALAPLPAVQPLSKKFYLGSILGAIAIVGICLSGMIHAIFTGSKERIAFTSCAAACVAFLAILYGGVVASILLYKIWAVIPRREARITPGWAVALMFIPFFNIYWQSQAYWGWTQDFNACMKRRNLRVTHAPEGLGLVICGLVVAGNGFGLLSALGMLVSVQWGSLGMTLRLLTMLYGWQGIALLFELPAMVLVVILLNRAIGCVNSLAAALTQACSVPVDKLREELGNAAPPEEIPDKGI